MHEQLWYSFRYTFLSGLLFYSIFHTYLRLKLESTGAVTPPHPEKPQVDMLEIKDEKGKIRLELPAESILCFEATGNYVTIHISENEKQRKELVRNNMKSIVSAFSEYGFTQCHRSYMVRLGAVSQVRKTGNGSAASLKGSDLVIPVSRTYTASFSEAIRAHGNMAEA
ncbi:LytR/AlgR family response regulator transcription factor [Fulvitalea axinellae]